MPTINGKACVVNGRNLLTSANGEIGNINGTNGEPIGYSFHNYYRTKDFIEVLPSTHYFLKVNSPSDTFNTIEKVVWYDSDKTYISSTGYNNTSTCAITSPKNAEFFKFTVFFENDLPAGTNVWRDNKVKFEEGTIPTALTPAPVDKVFSNGTKVYGRNLLQGTSGALKSMVIKRNAVGGWINAMNSRNPRLYDLVSGQTYTYRVWMEPPVDAQVDVACRDATDTKTISEFKGTVVKAGVSGYSTATFTVPEGTVSTTFYTIHSFDKDTESTANQTWSWKGEKLEQGNVPTAWSPAPEDVM